MKKLILILLLIPLLFTTTSCSKETEISDYEKAITFYHESTPDYDLGDDYYTRLIKTHGEQYSRRDTLYKVELDLSSYYIICLYIKEGAKDVRFENALFNDGNYIYKRYDKLTDVEMIENYRLYSSVAFYDMKISYDYLNDIEYNITEMKYFEPIYPSGETINTNYTTRFENEKLLMIYYENIDDKTMMLEDYGNFNETLLDWYSLPIIQIDNINYVVMSKRGCETLGLMEIAKTHETLSENQVCVEQNLFINEIKAWR